MFTLRFDAAALDQLDDASRRAGDEAAAVFLAELANINCVKAVDVLAREHAVEGLRFINVFRKRCLNEDAVDVRIRVERVDLRKECLFADIFRQDMQAAADADPMCSFFFLSHVRDRGGVFPNADHRDDWLLAGERTYLYGEFFNNGFCDSVAVDEFHGFQTTPSSTPLATQLWALPSARVQF